MTEAEWLACTDPRKMLAFLADKASDRKLRLFACACCRNIWDGLDTHTQAAIESLEKYAGTFLSVDATIMRAGSFGSRADGKLGVITTSRSRPGQAFVEANQLSLTTAWSHPEEYPASAYSRQAHALREIFGSPFRTLSLVPSWSAWDDGTIPKLAQTIYDERAFDRLPILADALEDAGCTDTDLLGHLRDPRPHVRGCWAVDLLLGKQ